MQSANLFRDVPDLQFPDRSCARAMFPRAKRRRPPRQRASTPPAPTQRARRFLLASKLSVESSAACSRILSELDVFLFSPKKYRPPRPMGVKGGCSPQNNLPKSGQLLPELKRCRYKNFYKSYGPFRNPLVSPVRMSILRVIPAIWTAKNFQPLAQGCDARFNFTCAMCVGKNRAVSPDRFWSRIPTCSTRTFAEQSFLYRRMLRRTARLE